MTYNYTTTQRNTAMADLDEIDREILRVLQDDGRRTFTALADDVGLSPPAVSDRMERLQELGVIRGYRADIDYSRIDGGVRVLIRLRPAADRADAVREALADEERVNHVFPAADGSVLAVATVPGADVAAFLADALDGDVPDYTITLLRDDA